MPSVRARIARATAMLPIRLKIAAASTLAVVILLLAAGLIFLTTLRSGLQNSLDNSLRSRSDELVSQVNTDGSVRATVASGAVNLADNTYGQVLADSDRILQSTAEKLPAALLNRDQVTSVSTGGTLFDVSVTEAQADPHRQQVRVLAVRIGPSTVVAVAISREVVDEAVERAGKQLLVVGFLVILVAAPGSWLLARSALRPVERMRAMAADLQASDAGGGLAVPATRDEVGRLGTTLNELLARLHDALQRERAFVADAGHELRTPLTVLRGELELARRPGRSLAELRETVEVASEETERLIRLAEDLLTLARDEGPDSTMAAEFDLSVTLRDAAARLESPATVKSVIIAVDSPIPLPVTGVPDRIRQAVDNLLSNALRYAPPSSTIRVSAEVAAGWARVEVSDEGSGFPPDLLAVAFERFRRGDVARTRDEIGGDGDAGNHVGSGLGLAIVRNILRSHEGDAEVANRVDGPGARVTLRWPSPPVVGSG